MQLLQQITSNKWNLLGNNCCACIGALQALSLYCSRRCLNSLTSKMSHSWKDAKIWVRAMVAYNFLLSETYTKKKWTSHAMFFIPSRALDVLFMVETTIICKPLHIITSCLKSILHRTNLHYISARKLYEILLIPFWVSQHTYLIYQWTADKIKPNKSTLGKKKSTLPLLQHWIQLKLDKT